MPTTQRDLEAALREYMPQVKEGDTRLGFPNKEITWRGSTYIVPTQQNSAVVTHLVGGSL